MSISAPLPTLEQGRHYAVWGEGNQRVFCAARQKKPWGNAPGPKYRLLKIRTAGSTTDAVPWPSRQGRPAAHRDRGRAVRRPYRGRRPDLEATARGSAPGAGVRRGLPSRPPLERRRGRVRQHDRQPVRQRQPRRQLAQPGDEPAADLQRPVRVGPRPGRRQLTRRVLVEDMRSRYHLPAPAE